MPTIQPSALAIVATNLARTDRRTLSEAWYDALHLAHETASAPEAATHFTSGAAGGAVPTRRAFLEAHVTPRDSQTHATTKSGDARLPRSLGPERRSDRSALARRIERAIVRRPNAPIASLAVRLDAGRMHLLVRSDGTRTRIIALCLPPQRALVEAALASARFTLAGRGIAVDTAVRSVA